MPAQAKTAPRPAATAATPDTAAVAGFATAVIRWQKQHGRHNLPWQNSTDPYKIWLSEIMLQQTQVATVINYYHKFLHRFPTIAHLARARIGSVLAVWQGLGYYARARHLHAAARHLHQHGIPPSADEWQKLPGIGKSTAAAIAIFSRGERHAILDGNVKRVLARVIALPQPLKTPAATAALWAAAQHRLPPRRHIRAYTQGMMDLGAGICTRTAPQCHRCPLTAHCAAHLRRQTAHYPVRTPAVAKPHRRLYMLHLRHCGKTLLQQRPPVGIWGGLWSLPENKSKTALSKNIGIATPIQTTTFTHTFTHYHLTATVLSYDTSDSKTFGLEASGAKTPANINIPDSKFFSQSQLKTIPLPSPIKKFLISL